MLVSPMALLVICFCLSLLTGQVVPMLVVSRGFMSSLFGKRQEDAFVMKLNEYLVHNTETADLRANLQLARHLVDNDKFESLAKRQHRAQELVNDDFKKLTTMFAGLSSGRNNSIGHKFQLCPARKLDRLRAIAELMNRNIDLTSTRASQLRVVALFEQATKEAGDICFGRLERKWHSLKRRNSWPDFASKNFAQIQTDFMLFANLCQKYQNKRRLDEQDDLFLGTLEYALVKTAKLRPDVPEAAQLTGRGLLGSDEILSLMTKLLIQPCREMLAVNELAQTIKPMADLLVTVVIVDQLNYYDRFMDGVSGELKDWTARFVLCEWLLEVRPERVARALAKSAQWSW